uniref:Very long-chain fatty acid transport protein n=1 Tax=Steinernema glaseri TaxID=37863 RepID=A0A1I7ZDN4_9BILA
MLLASLLMWAVGPSHYLKVAAAYVLFRIFSSELAMRCVRTLPRDLKGLALLVKVHVRMRAAFRANRPLSDMFLEVVKQHPDKEAVVEVESGRTLTFTELNALANQYVNYFQSIGYRKGDVVALYVENSAAFFAIWLGLSKVGIVTAWINSNLKLEPLAHSIKVSNCKCIVTTSTLLPTYKNAVENGLLPRETPLFLVDDSEDRSLSFASFGRELAEVTTKEPTRHDDVDFKSVLCYIYTSGTTGNPKPAIIKHFRFYMMAMGTGKAFGIMPSDRMYITMPMYHSAAGILGVGQCVTQGATIVIRKKFSATNFWRDCARFGCTGSQYIGEICRYLLAQKRSPEEREHRVRVMFGNGLRGELWTEFVERFGVQKIGELYGSTEGNSNILNIDNKVGACGFFPIYPFLTKLYPVRLVKVDEETGEIVRDKDGLCVSCRPGETGEMVGVIDKKDPLLHFEGYVDKKDTSKKILTNVFKKGDCVFSSGDILYWDEYGYLFFKDRRGDTFRWKGENVSTTEVEGILQPVMSVEDATVYGVEIPGRCLRRVNTT